MNKNDISIIVCVIIILVTNVSLKAVTALTKACWMKYTWNQLCPEFCASELYGLIVEPMQGHSLSELICYCYTIHDWQIIPYHR
jgi:hypothetical protein